MKFEVLVAVGTGFMCVAAGAGIMSFMFDWLPDSQTISIKAGEEYATTSILGRTHGHISGSFRTEDGSQIRFLILDDEQYNVYLSGGNPVEVYEVVGNDKSFDSDIGERRYHLVFERLETGQSTDLKVIYVLSVTGIVSKSVLLSGASAAAGLAFVALALLLRSREIREDRKRRV